MTEQIPEKITEQKQNEVLEAEVSALQKSFDELSGKAERQKILFDWAKKIAAHFSANDDKKVLSGVLSKIKTIIIQNDGNSADLYSLRVYVEDLSSQDLVIDEGEATVRIRFNVENLNQRLKEIESVRKSLKIKVTERIKYLIELVGENYPDSILFKGVIKQLMEIPNESECVPGSEAQDKSINVGEEVEIIVYNEDLIALENVGCSIYKDVLYFRSGNSYNLFENGNNKRVSIAAIPKSNRIELIILEKGGRQRVYYIVDGILDPNFREY